MNMSMKQKQTHKHNEQTYICQEEGKWERDGLGVWDWNHGVGQRRCQVSV